MFENYVNVATILDVINFSVLFSYYKF